jgi:hypothetical protein
MCAESVQWPDMDKWTELRTAYQVARLGTVSAAAEVLVQYANRMLKKENAVWIGLADDRAGKVA